MLSVGQTTGFSGLGLVICMSFTFNSLPSEDCTEYCNCEQSGGRSLSNSPRVSPSVSTTDSFDLFLSGLTRFLPCLATYIYH